MSLFKQLLILISALFLMIFSINFIISVNNIKSYLQGEAEIHAQDTATSLGLSLSPYMVNETDPIIETMMNAIFDRGYYQEIKLLNVESQPLVVLNNSKQFEGVPSWFVDNISMKTIRAESEISSGWAISGVIYVTLNPGYAYLKLYEQAKSGFYFSLAIFIFSLSVLFVVLRITLRSLKNIDQMAQKIAQGQYETIEKLPWTTEVRNVTASMNRMCDKIKGVITNLNGRLDGIGQKLQLDDLTGLYKKCCFETEMKKLFVAKDPAYIFMIKIDQLGALVKELAPKSIDEFLIDFAEVLSSVTEQTERAEINCYRFFGSEFALIVRKVSDDQVTQLAQALSQAFSKLGAGYNKSDLVHIGVAPFNVVASTDSILLAANEAYEQARLIGENSFYIRSSEDQAKDIAQWKDLVFRIIDNQDYYVSFAGQVESFQNNQLLMEEVFTQVIDEKGDVVAIGTFVSIAEKYAKIIDLDKGVASQVIEIIKSKKISHSVAINLSTRTIKSSDFRSWLINRIKQNPIASKQLVFSLSAYAVAKEVSVYKEFIAFVHSLGCKVMIKRYETQSMSPEVIKELKPDFIRLARGIGYGIAKDDGKREFVETLQEIATLLNIKLLAENITADNDFNCMRTLGIAGASR